MKRIVLVALAAAGAAGIALGAAAPSQAAKPAPTAPTAAPYLGRWATQAVVYDSTGGGNWFRIAEAVGEWRTSGWNVVTTSDPARANITVVAEDSSIFGAIGDASPVSSGGVITSCTVHLAPSWATLTGGQQLAIHELGHCGGLPHSTSSRSAMYSYTSSSSTLSSPTRDDLKWMAGNYR
ncbi:matrixin family metalloprotease [Terrabacter terrigena]|uniref:Matrixin family metalloprotease n=1 Tax=Terrabacter terrigena TaxID=574718 RepID=A0ABW3MZJ1_9MICO